MTRRIIVSAVLVLVVCAVALLLVGWGGYYTRSKYCGHGATFLNGRIHEFRGERFNSDDHWVRITTLTGVGDGDVKRRAIALDCH